MVRIRLRRVGRKKAPVYRIVVADSQSPRDGKFIEIIGQYAPRQAQGAPALLGRRHPRGFRGVDRLTHLVPLCRVGGRTHRRGFPHRSQQPVRATVLLLHNAVELLLNPR